MSFTHPPKALLFDVFGTVVDWRTTITTTLITRSHLALSSATSSLPSTVRVRASDLTPSDWGAFAQQWRNSYLVFTRTHDPSQPPQTVDEHHHRSLISLLQEWQLQGLWRDDEVLEISRAWHFLAAWPDSPRGIAELNKLGFVTCTLSNGNHELLSDLAAHGSLPWTRMFCATDFGAYKPDPRVYVGAVGKLRLPAGECAMVAAHLGDLEAARKGGLQTVYVERAGEEAWSEEHVREAKREGWVNMWVKLDETDSGGGLLEVARRLKVGHA
ncbi:Haloacid dehalogenase, type II [Lasallia pustulata]|uniref:Haloacid dehalogenase, type II n=1 Tax=Lasallia pustulata TaxID=136370 RepID=A0A1W5D693_9LECA|nr:Haloacid dehalogenase, type II [Lasallia pustulata]